MAAVQNLLLRVFIAVTTILIGVQCGSLHGRVGKLTILSGEDTTERTNQQRRFRRENPSTNSHHCALLSSPWLESNVPSKDRGLIYRLKVLPMSDGPRRAVFPEQPLFRFVRRVYRCCQTGNRCENVKGIQGRLSGSHIDFLLSEDVLSVTVVRAEIHLHISNPQQLNIQPLVPFLEKRKLPTRYSVGVKDTELEMRVDLLFLFRALQQATGGARGRPSLIDMRRAGGLSRPGAPEPREWVRALQETTPAEPGEVLGPLRSAVELGLALHCSGADATAVHCQSHGVQLLHTPFIALSYR
ncbi:uncharacterized protein LOC115806401 [Chanos chanos]|uniref:Uncharacterized protein LOC115806401 n=1 Tax=Chanos chanos TaxID=29144 RepID=A0A6J2UUD8_CHACN|nr:uncharacterized protein LOC115806401 [Chanos chanos]